MGQSNGGHQLLAGLLTLSLTGCGVLPTVERPPLNAATQNPPDRFDSPNADSPMQLANRKGPTGPGTPWGDEEKAHLFVGLAISGGGSRSAVFSASVLEELERIGLLEETYAISSVSGGSLTSAYYVLHPSTGTSDYWDNFRRNVGQDLLTPWIRKMAAPHNLAYVSISTKDRSDLMADVMNKRVFNDATFLSYKRKFHRGSSPLLLINATLVSNSAEGAVSGQEQNLFSASGKRRRLEAGDGFAFTEKSLSELGSDISEMRIADAVMTSGAFPGVFSTRTLGSYQPKSSLDLSRSERPSSYIHLIDGGPADNLGIDTLTTVALGWHDLAFMVGRDKIDNIRPDSKYKGCLLIAIDASTGKLNDESNERDVRRPIIDYFVDTNALHAIDAMMKRRRAETLKFAGIDTRIFRGDKAPRFVQEVKLQSLANPWLIHLDEEFPSLTCSVWHIALDRLAETTKSPISTDSDIELEKFIELMNYISQIPADTPMPIALEQLREKLQLPVEPAYIEAISKTASSVATNYKLSSSICGSENDIETVLRAAARQLVLGDDETRNQICIWMEQRGLPGAERCRTAVHSRFTLPECASKSIRTDTRDFDRLWQFEPNG